MNKIRLLVQAIVMIGILTSCDSCDDEALNGAFKLNNGKIVTLEGVASAGERNAILNALHSQNSRLITVLERNITIVVESAGYAEFKVYAGSPCTRLGINRAYISDPEFGADLLGIITNNMYNNTVSNAVPAGNLAAMACNLPATAGNAPTMAGNLPAMAGNFPAMAGNLPAMACNLAALAWNLPAMAWNAPAMAGA